jgi:predicted ATPase
MLLINQTLISRVVSRSVVLNGLLTKLGQFDDLRSFNSDSNQIVIGWECKPSVSDDEFPYSQQYGRRRDITLRQVNCEVSFDADPTFPQQDLLQLNPRLFASKITSIYQTEDSLELQASVQITRSKPYAEKIRELEIEEPVDEMRRQSMDYDLEFDASSLKEFKEDLKSLTPIGCRLRHFLPRLAAVRVDIREQKATTISNTISEFSSRLLSSRRGFDGDTIIPEPVIELLINRIGRQLIFQVLPDLQQQTLFQESKYPAITLENWLDGVKQINPGVRVQLRRTFQEHEPSLGEEIHNIVMKSEERKYAVQIMQLPFQLADATQYIEFIFSNRVKYLGPLRDEPKPLYPLATSIDPADIGLKGEFTAAVLDLNKERKIKYIPASSFGKPNVDTDAISRSLEAAVIDWLQYMGMAETIRTEDSGKYGHKLQVTTPGTSILHDLTHVGVGISQVLPILVMCLLAEPDTTLIIEQPELHLHPKVQTLLADFFLSMAILGKQCIIETHSEYIINRLRFRAAAAMSETLSSLMKVYFVEKKEGNSVFRPVEVNKYGAITDWPDGFFDQSQSEAEEILRAATLKRKAEKGK